MASWSSSWSGRSNDSMRLTVTQGSQNVNNNTTVVNWYLDIIEVNGTWTNDPTGSYSININGSVYSGTVPGYAKHTTTRIRSGSTTVTHNADGTKTINVSASASGVNILGSASIPAKGFTLSTIPRATTPSFSGGSSWDCGTAKTINLPRASSSFTHTVTYKFGSATGTISSSATTSVSWTPPLSLLTQIPNATSGSGTLTVVTKNGSTTIGTKTASFTLKAPASAKPSISSFTLSDDVPAVVSAVGTYVQGYSILKGVIASSGYQGSTIKTATFKMGSVSANSGGTIPVIGSGTIEVTATVTDSRGRSTTSTQNISVLAYDKPTVTSWQARRSDASGTVENEGTYIRVDLTTSISSLLNGSTQKNSMVITVFTRERGTTNWGSAKRTINSTLSYSGTFVLPSSGGGTYLAADSYDILVTVTDKLDNSSVQKTIATASVFMHWSKTGVGIGKFHEQGRLDVAGDIYFSGELKSGVVPWERMKAEAGFIGTTDLDTLLSTGKYVQTQNAQATTARHYPFARAGTLEVVSYGTIASQTYIEYLNNLRATRSYYSGVWSDWFVEYLKTEDWTDLTSYLSSGISYVADGAGDLAGIRARRVGNMAELSLGNVVVASISVPIHGNVTNTNILENIPTKFRPATGISMGSGWNGRVWGGYVRPNGTVVIGSIVPDANASGTKTHTNEYLSGAVTYAVADPSIY